VNTSDIEIRVRKEVFKNDEHRKYGIGIAISNSRIAVNVVDEGRDEMNEGAYRGHEK